MGEHISPDEYASNAHQEYQRLENLEAIKTFFDPDGGHGIDHARQSVATEKWLDCVENGLGLRGRADNILRTDEGIHVIDYKRKLRDVITSNTASVLEDHLDGTDHDPKRVKNVFQAATYIEGIKQSDLYEDGMNIRFSFYGLLNHTSFESTPDGYEISVRGYPRDTTDIYEEYHDTIWDLLQRAHEGITSGSHDPDPFPLIHDEACPDCKYREMCTESRRGGEAMSDDVPDWLPTIEDDEDPKPQQRTIIESERYPMRVLAGAGTGKTFTMVRKIENLIDEHGVSPDRILALTFTNNAADSMREKLNAKLGPAGYDVDAYTYHSICNEILTDYAYDAGLDPDFEIATDAEKYVIVLDVLDEIDYRAVKPNVYGPDSYVSGVASKLLSFIGSMKRSGISPAEIEEYLGSPEQVYELDAVPDRVEEIASDHLGGRSVSTVLDGIQDTRADLVAERDTLRDEGLEASIKDFLDRLVDLCDALEVAFEEYEAGERSLPEDAHKLPKYLLGGYSSAPSGIPNDLKLELTDYLRNALDECKTALDLNAGYETYERELDRRNLLDFDGLVVKTVELLETDVGEGLGDRWDYVFCDEFQDTDRLQFDLITSLVSEDCLFVVGDDDQAIYEWRGANVANITDELDDVFGPDLEDEPPANRTSGHVSLFSTSQMKHQSG